MNKDIDIQLKEHLEYLDDLLESEYSSLRTFREGGAEDGSEVCAQILLTIGELSSKRSAILDLVCKHLTQVVVDEHKEVATNLPPSVV